MERRLRRRHRAQVNIYVYCPGQRMQRCTARNLSPNGVYIETGLLSLSKGHAVELVFPVRRGAVIRLHRRWATVAHVAGQGAGLRINSTTRPFMSTAVPYSA